MASSILSCFVLELTLGFLPAFLGPAAFLGPIFEFGDIVNSTPAHVEVELNFDKIVNGPNSASVQAAPSKRGVILARPCASAIRSLAVHFEVTGGQRQKPWA